MACAVFLLFVFSVSYAQESKPTQNVSIEDLTFISGHSRGEYDGGIADEHWSEPAGDSMMGVSRYLKGGKVQEYYLMVVEQTPKGPVLRVMDFKPGLDAWDEKARVVTNALIHLTKSEAIFERQDKEVRLTYRTAGNGVLESTIERTGKKTDPYQYTHPLRIEHGL